MAIFEREFLEAGEHVESGCSTLPVVLSASFLGAPDPKQRRPEEVFFGRGRKTTAGDAGLAEYDSFRMSTLICDEKEG